MTLFRSLLAARASRMWRRESANISAARIGERDRKRGVVGLRSKGGSEQHASHPKQAKQSKAVAMAASQRSDTGTAQQERRLSVRALLQRQLVANPPIELASYGPFIERE